jgi:geranylgeranyl diphosphate synthase type I
MRTPKPILIARETFEEYGIKAYEEALATISKERFEYAPVRKALLYFMKRCWRNCQHAALVALACEAVGGDPEETTKVGASLVLLTGAADIHDDIIDQSATKNRRLTVAGKYGKDMALLVGDALLMEGCTLLNDSCLVFPEDKARRIRTLVKNGFFELGCAEAEEAGLRGVWSTEPETLLAVMKRKAAIAETATCLGAMVGDGSLDEIEDFCRYGRALAMLVNIRDEFVDIFEPEELRNRIRNECLPLPMLYALRNKDLRDKLTSRLKGGNASIEELSRLAHSIISADEVQPLKDEVSKISEVAYKSLSRVRKVGTAMKLSQLIKAAAEEMW